MSTYSRRFRLMKSCFPDPVIPPPPATTTTTISITISAIPDDVLLEILCRVPTSSLRSISSVCRRWSHLVNSPSFADLRREHGLLKPSVFVFSPSTDHGSIITARLDQDGIWKNVSFALPDDVATGCFRLVAIGTAIYVVCKTVTLKCDVWTGRVTPKSEMIFPRKKFAAAVLNGKIYVAGGSGSISAVEEYDPETDTWAVVSHAPRSRYGCVGAAADGVFYVIGGLKVGISRARATPIAVTSSASSMDLYNVATGKWLRGRVGPARGCLVAACALNDNLYLLASHAVEFSFWRFNGRRGDGFGGWCRLPSPPVLAMVGPNGPVRFGCIAMGEKVVLIQIMGGENNLLRRGSRSGRQGLVLVYDTVVGAWSRGAHLPEVIKRATPVCVEC